MINNKQIFVLSETLERLNCVQIKNELWLIKK